MKITRREFVRLTAGVAAISFLPNVVMGGENKMSKLVIRNVNYLKPSGEVEVGNI